MSHVDFKKYKFHPVEFKNAHVALSNLRNCHVLCHYFFISQFSCRMSFRPKRPHVALSIGLRAIIYHDLSIIRIPDLLLVMQAGTLWWWA